MLSAHVHYCIVRRLPWGFAVVSLVCLALTGCFRRQEHLLTASHDRPFPLGQVTDSHWETQQTNAEAADFVFYDHEFVGDTAQLAPGAKRHLEQVALRLEHTPFPIVIEQSAHNAHPELDQQRRVIIIENLGKMGITDIENRVVVASAFAEGFTATEGERAYYQGILSGGYGFGRRFGGWGGLYR